MKRVFSPFYLLTLLIFSTVVSLPFIHLSRRIPYALEVTLASPAHGHIQVYYAVDGKGFSESDSARLPLTAEPAAHVYSLSIPGEHYNGLRLDPVDNDSAITIVKARIVRGDGQVMREFAAGDFSALNGIARLAPQADGSLLVEPVAGSVDPYLAMRLDPPLSLPAYPTLSAALADMTGTAVWIFAGSLLLSLAVAAFYTRNPGRIRAAWDRATAWAQRKPQKALALTALASLVASSYPVIFLGRSFVSPDVGTALLYFPGPFLPGYEAEAPENVWGSDVGAMMWYFVPATVVEHDAVFRDGELPLWTRYNSSGTSLLGQMVSMFGDPLHWVVIAADSAAWAWDLQFLTARWLFAFGCALLAWQMCRHLPASMLAGFSSLFVGFFLFRINHPAIFSLCYSPWILYCWVRAAESRGLRGTTVWAAWLILANWAEFNSGTAKESTMLMACLNCTGLLAMLVSARPLRQKLAQLLVLGGSQAVFLLLSAPFWLTFLDTLHNSYTFYDKPAAAQIPLQELPGFFDEILYHYRATWTCWPSVNFLVMLGLFYFLATLGRVAHGRLALAAAAGSLVPFALTFGIIPPEFIYKIPFLNNVHHVGNVFSCVLIVHFIPLAAVGFAAAWKRLGTHRGWLDAGLVLLLLAALTIDYRPFWQNGHGEPPGWGASVGIIRWIWSRQIHEWVWGYAVAQGIALLAFLLLARVMLKKQRATPALAILAVLCVAVMIWRFGEHATAVRFQRAYRPGVRADFQAPSTAIQRAIADSTEPRRVIGLFNYLFAGWTGVYRLEGINGPDALINPYYRELMFSLGFMREGDWHFGLGPDRVEQLKPAADFLNVGYYFDEKDQGLRLKPVLEPVVSADLQVYRSNTVWPRAFFTDRLATYHASDDLAKLVANGDGKPFAAWQDDEGAPPIKMDNALAGRTVVPARDYKLSTNETSFTVNAPGPGVVALQEAWFKDDFRVKVNGHPADYFRINHAFKGVFVPAAGDYRITFSYWPRHFTLSLVLFACGVVALAGSLACVLRFLPREPAA